MLDVNVADEQSAPTTRQTVPGNPGVNSGVAGFSGLGVNAGYSAYGNSPMMGRLPDRSLSAFNLSTLDFLETNPLLALELLPMIFPDASLAVHNILRLGNPGWSINCYNTKSGKQDKAAARLCTEMMELANRGVDCAIPGAMGGADALINSLLFNAYIKGAVCTETVLDESFTVLDDIVSVDPFSIQFEERAEKRGRYKIYQARGSSLPNSIYATNAKPVAAVPTMPSHTTGNTSAVNNGAGADPSRVELNPNLITYVPLDESLYGRSMVAPALQLLVFWTRFYISLQVFLHNVAFGDIDGEVDTSLLLTILDRNLSAQERQNFERDFWGELLKLIGRFADDYKANTKKNPSSARIHSDLLKMSALGTARTAYPVKEVMQVCKREIYAALKMLPVLMGETEGATETHATVQMQVFSSGLTYIQGAVRHSIERPLQVGLRAMGYGRAVRVELQFAVLSLDDRLAAAKAVAQEIENAARKAQLGYITQDEASEDASGSPAVMDGVNGEPAENPLHERPQAAAPAAPAADALNPTPADTAAKTKAATARSAARAARAAERAETRAGAAAGKRRAGLRAGIRANPVGTYAINAPAAIAYSPAAVR